MNYIIAPYFTSSIDIQRNMYISGDDVTKVMTWYRTIEQNQCQGIILHDGLLESFISLFPKIQFVEVPKVPNRYTVYDYRWIAFNDFLQTLDAENVFFTDLFDVAIINNPFIQKEYHPDELYCGSEGHFLATNTWIRQALVVTELRNLPGFIKIFTTNNIMYNCGVIGGGKAVVQEFLNNFVNVLIGLQHRGADKTTDMALCNYILHKYHHPITGWPIHSVFKKYEDRKDIWFKHK